jgi:chorismate synthase
VVSNGEDIVFSVAFKPPATIGKAQVLKPVRGL